MPMARGRSSGLWVSRLLSSSALPLCSHVVHPICCHQGSLPLFPLWGCISTHRMSLSLPLLWLHPLGLIDGSHWLSIGVGIQVRLPEARIDGQDRCPGRGGGSWGARSCKAPGLWPLLPGPGSGSPSSCKALPLRWE